MPDNFERNRQIAKLIEEGKSFYEVGLAFDLHEMTIRKIIRTLRSQANGQTKSKQRA